MRSSRTAGIAATLLVALIVAGCSTATKGMPMPALSYQEAVDRVERSIADAASFLTPSPVLTLVGNTDVPCSESAADGSQFNGQVQVGHSYFVGGLPAGRSKPDLVSALVVHWTTQGYQVTSDERPQNQTVRLTDPASRFGVSIDVNDRGDVALVASSPCVWP